MTRNSPPVTATVDGRELFMKFAGQVMRGEIIITDIAAHLTPERRQYVTNLTGQTWDGSRLDMKIVAEENLSSLPVSVPVTVPVQVRELIFDEPARPIFDADLADDE